MTISQFCSITNQVIEGSNPRSDKLFCSLFKVTINDWFNIHYYHSVLGITKNKGLYIAPTFSWTIQFFIELTKITKYLLEKIILLWSLITSFSKKRVSLKGSRRDLTSAKLYFGRSKIEHNISSSFGCILYYGQTDLTTFFVFKKQVKFYVLF